MITTDANDLVAEYHAKKRMPVILHADDYDLWLNGTPEKAKALLRPFPRRTDGSEPNECMTDEFFSQKDQELQQLTFQNASMGVNSHAGGVHVRRTSRRRLFLLLGRAGPQTPL